MTVFCRDCGRSSALFELWNRNGHPYCAGCFQVRFGTHPVLTSVNAGSDG